MVNVDILQVGQAEQPKFCYMTVEEMDLMWSSHQPQLLMNLYRTARIVSQASVTANHHTHPTDVNMLSYRVERVVLNFLSLLLL
jgi:hypothetical protein